MTRNFQLPGRSAVYGTRAMIATSHPEASLVGLEVLKSGGTAVDAAIAACALLGVVEPGMTGVGGDCFAIVAPPGQSPITINGSGRAPAAATLERAASQGITVIEDNSPFAVTVPGAVDAWGQLHRDYGRLDLARLLEPAAIKAEEGYAVAPRVAFDWKRNEARLRYHPPAAAVFLPSGKAPLVGDVHRQPALARTLRAIGRGGRDAFYSGEVVGDIVDTLNALGGVHTLDDFMGQHSTYEAPISSTFEGVDVLECPPNGQGLTALLILKALEGWERYTRISDEAAKLRLFAEVSRAAYALRDAVVTDPAAMPVSVQEFLSDAAVAFVRNAVDLPISHETSLGAAPWETDTICLSVVDQDGLAVSFINSLFNAFGSTILAPRSGVLLHCRGTSFRLDAAHPNGLAPRKRPMHTIIPGMVMKGERALMPFGVMGGQYQAAGHAHLLLRLLKEGMDLQSGVDAPRVFGLNGTLQVEAGIDETTIRHFESHRHRVERLETPMGGAQAIWIDHDRGVLIGASDPRKDGCALGF
jgi:gamma-glutamyltranspeptidase/glutathione hydrolase